MLAANFSRRDLLSFAGITGVAAVTVLSLPTAQAEIITEAGPAPVAGLVAHVRMKPDGGAVIRLASAQIAERMEVVWQPQFSHEDRDSAGERSSPWASRQRAHDTARALLAAFAARRWNVKPADCGAWGGQIVHIPSGRAVSYLIWSDFG